MYLKFAGKAVRPTYFSRLCLFKVGVGACPSPLLQWRVLHVYCCRLCVFKVHAVDCTPLQCVLGTPPPLLHVLFSTLFFIQVFFSWGRGQAVKGAMLVYPRGGMRTLHATYLLTCWSASSRLGAGIWRHGSPPGFSM
jgi:hypothetical protein